MSVVACTAYLGVSLLLSEMARWTLRHKEISCKTHKAQHVFFLSGYGNKGLGICLKFKERFDQTYIRPPFLRTHTARLAVIRMLDVLFFEHCITLVFSTLSLLFPPYLLPSLYRSPA